jgi:hypothetical protein
VLEVVRELAAGNGARIDDEAARASLERAAREVAAGAKLGRLARALLDA